MKLIATAVLLFASTLPAQQPPFWGPNHPDETHTHTNGNGHSGGHNGWGHGHHNPRPRPPENGPDCPPAAPVPEPATMVLMGTGLAGYALLRSRRKTPEVV